VDNVIHTLCGLALARAGVDKLGPWSTGTLLVASNIPDLDGVMLLWGDQQNYLQHHRGITHGVPGLLLQGVLLGIAVCLLARRQGVSVRFMTATAIAWLGTLTHLGLDALNSYGVRPLLPFDDRWFYFDVAFVADPWIWLGLTAAAALGGPPGLRKGSGFLILVFIGLAIVLRTEVVPVAVGLSWFAAMLVVVFLRICGIGTGHRRALARTALGLTATYITLLGVGSRTAHDLALEVLDKQLSEIQRTSTHPQPGFPWRFRVMVQTADRLHRAAVDLRLGTVDGITEQARGLDNPEVGGARLTPEYEVWLGFARHPFAGMWEGQLVLGDGRYSGSPVPSWCNLVVDRK
jgi:inner membrane protein